MKQIYYPGSLTEKELESIENLLQYLDELNHSYTRTENTVVVAVNGKKGKPPNVQSNTIPSTPK